MFTWFTIKDSPGTWQSGFFTNTGRKKPGYGVFASTAKGIDGQTQFVVPGKYPVITADVPFIYYHDKPGTTLGVTYRVYQGKKLVFVQQARAKLQRTGTVSFKLGFKPTKGTEYTVDVDVGDDNGQHQRRTIALLPVQSAT
jgi:hypothetical protein